MQAFAEIAIIRDSEIEEAIEAVAQPVIKAAGLKEIKIHLLHDPALNAFTAGGNEIYINSGLIAQFPDIDVLRGVIAHEIGHILGKHIIRQIENIDIYSKVAFSSIALGLASAAAGNPSIAQAIALGGGHFAQRAVLSHSRAFESSADQTALKLLERSGNTTKGMLKFFEDMHNKHANAFVNPYDQTHPLGQERIKAIKNFYQKSKFQASQNSKDLEYKFARAAAKLIAFTGEPNKILQLPHFLRAVEAIDYLKAICYFRLTDLSRSLHYIDKLLAVRPQDAFYHELKGQILFEFGKKEALSSYQTAAALRPNDMLIKLSKVIVGMNIYDQQPLKIKELYHDLKLVSNNEPDNIVALYYLSVYYEKLDKQFDRLLSLATIAYKMGEIERAKKLAKAAIKGFPPNTPQWYKANDIILMEK